MLTSFYARNIFPVQWCVRLSPWHECYEFLGTVKQANPAHEISCSVLFLATDKQEPDACQIYTCLIPFAWSHMVLQVTEARRACPYRSSRMPLSKVVTVAQAHTWLRGECPHQSKVAAVWSLWAVVWVRSTHVNGFAIWSECWVRNSRVSPCFMSAMISWETRDCLSVLTGFQNGQGYCGECTYGIWIENIFSTFCNLSSK